MLLIICWGDYWLGREFWMDNGGGIFWILFVVFRLIVLKLVFLSFLLGREVYGNMNKLFFNLWGKVDLCDVWDG